MALKSIFKKNKKANLWTDSFFIFLSLIVFGMVAIIGSYILNLINTDIQSNDDMSQTAKESIDGINTDLPTWYDYGIGFVLVAMWVLSIFLSLQIDSHPVFFIISVIVLMVILFAINQTMDAVDDLTNDADIAPITVNFPITMFIYQYIEIIIALIGFTIALGLYAKNRA